MQQPTLQQLYQELKRRSNYNFVIRIGEIDSPPSQYVGIITFSDLPKDRWIEFRIDLQPAYLTPQILSRVGYIEDLFHYEDYTTIVELVDALVEYVNRYTVPGILG